MEPIDLNEPVLEIPEGLADRPNLDPKLANLPEVPRLGAGNLPVPQPTWDLDTVLFKFGSDAPFTIRHSNAGVIVFGQSGSGKTSGIGKLIQSKYLEHGFGVLVLCVKPEEGSAWVNYAKDAGREKDVIRITTDPNCPYRFDFLAYSMNQPGSTTLAEVLMIQNVAEVLRRKEGGGGSNDAFWSASANRLLKNAIDLYKLSYQRGSELKALGHLPPDEWLPPYKPTLLFILELITSAVTDVKAFNSQSVIDRSLNAKCLLLAEKVAKFHAKSPSKTSAGLVNTFNLTANFWRNEWAKDGAGDSRLRDNIIAFAQSTIEPLEKGEVASLFQRALVVDPEDGCEKYLDTVIPDMVDEGKIIIVDIPTKQYAQAGQLAGAIWKDAIQRYSDRRSVRTDKKVEEAKARYAPRVAEAKRKLASFPPETLLERALPEFLKTGPRQKALAEYTYAEAKLKWEVKRVEDSVRPIAIYVDEAHKFAVRGDVDFQTTARSNKVSTVYLTQNNAVLDNAVGEEVRKGLVSNLTTVVFCKNLDPGTNECASSMIGSKFKSVKTEGETYQNLGHAIKGKLFGGASLSSSRTKQLLPVVPASEFADLAVGGPNNDYRVEAYVIGAERFQNGKTWLKATFDQNLGELKVQAPAKLRAKALARVRREAP